MAVGRGWREGVRALESVDCNVLAFALDPARLGEDEHPGGALASERDWPFAVGRDAERDGVAQPWGAHRVVRGWEEGEGKRQGTLEVQTTAATPI